MIARVATLLCLLALLAPGAALAQGGGAFDPLPPAPAEPPPQTQQPQDLEQDENDGLSSTQQLLIGLAGFVMLIGIAWAILRDAKSAAPADSRRGPALPGERPQPKGSQRPAGVRHRQSRQKAKAARQARKKARKR